MASNKLFSLFDEKLRSPHELVAGPSQNLDSLGNQVELSGTLLRKIQQFEIVKPKVDYSDFANFVFFNSALDYFNITGEKILNEYPYDGTREELETFTYALDNYQQHVMNVWPSSVGHLKFDPAQGFAYVQVEDVGKDGETTKTSLLNPSTSSLSVEFWSMSPPPLTGTNDVMIVAQKVTGSGDGFSVFFSGSSLFMQLTSGSSTDSISVPVTPGENRYFCFVWDRSSTAPIMRVFSGSADFFPTLVAYTTGTVNSDIAAGPARFYIGSGSLTGKLTRPLTGSLDDLRFWRVPRDIVAVSSSFNTKIYSQEGLYGLWSFNETGSLPATISNERVIVRDMSGRKLHGVIQNYYVGIREPTSLVPYDVSVPILSLNAPEVSDFISTQQLSGTIYDRTNDNALMKMLPEQFFLLEEFKNTSVLQNFVYVLGRYFDQIKVSIDQFAHVLKNDYGSYNQTPDALLQDIAKFFGWEFTGNFLDSDAVQYLLGKQVLANTQANKELDTKLYEIKNEFWKRTLINLMHIYKTKGTRESVETLLRVYGVNKNFVRLKEYGRKPNAGIRTFRINSEKSVAALTFGSGSAMPTNRVVSTPFTGKARTVESRLRFPSSTSVGMTASLATGSIWSMNFVSDGTPFQRLYYTKSDPSSVTGSLFYTGSEGAVTLSDVPIFDNRWYNVAVLRDYTSSSLVIDVRRLERDEVTYHQTASLFTPLLSSSGNYVLWLGSTGSMGSQNWMQEVRVWDEPLREIELQDHTLNFQSFGAEETNGLNEISLHWRLNENLSSSTAGWLYNSIFDFAGTGVSGSGMGFISETNPYKKFLNEYNYIAPPEFGWNEEKIRSIDTSTPRPEDAFVDDPLVALEFNLVDALNEDISQIIATLDGFNEFIAAPANRYRDSYPDLDVLRFNYFKRLQGSINFRVFADLLEFFDRSFIDLVRRLIPARAVFLGDEFVVESHMLERPKLQWTYRRKDVEFQPEGVIKVYIRS